VQRTARECLSSREFEVQRDALPRQSRSREVA